MEKEERSGFRGGGGGREALKGQRDEKLDKVFQSGSDKVDSQCKSGESSGCDGSKSRGKGGQNKGGTEPKLNGECQLGSWLRDPTEFRRRGEEGKTTEMSS